MEINFNIIIINHIKQNLKKIFGLLYLNLLYFGNIFSFIHVSLKTTDQFALLTFSTH